jgi:hypothetical protein
MSFSKNLLKRCTWLCRSCVNRHFGGTYCLHLQSRTIREQATSVSRWPQTRAHAGSSFAACSTLKMEAIRSLEMSVHTRYTQCHIPEDGILHSHRCENLKSYIICLRFNKHNNTAYACMKTHFNINIQEFQTCAPNSRWKIRLY